MARGGLGLNMLRCVSIIALVFLLAVTTHGQQILRSFSGDQAHASLGSLAPAGDLDGDGVPDLLAGAPLDATAGAQAGSATAVSGADGSVLTAFAGSAPGELFGWSVVSLGDVDGDGLADVAVGAPGAAGRGVVRVFSGASGDELYVLAGNELAGFFGGALAAIGDVDGDGIGEFAVGAPGEALSAGRIHVFSGASGEPLGSRQGEAVGDRLGSSIHGVSDVDSGGMVGFSDVDSGGAVGAACGATQSGNDGGGYVLLLDATDLSVTNSWSGDAAGDRLGNAVRFVGDLDGDGVMDVMAGSDPRLPSGAPSGPGYARVWSGADGSEIMTLRGDEPGTGYSSHIEGVGDTNGDGVADIVVSEPGSDDNGINTGSITLYSGADGSVLHIINGPSSANVQFGACVAWAGDLNADGLADFAVSAPFGDEGGEDAGNAWILSVGPWTDVSEGLPGIAGIPRLIGQGGLFPESEVILSMEDARTETTATLVLGYSLFIDSAYGLLSPMPDTIVTGLQTGEEGKLDYTFTWPEGLPSGFRIYYQYHVTDAAAPGGKARSNAVASTVP